MEQFEFTDKHKKLFMGLMLVGVAAVAYGAFTDGHRTWVNALIDGFYFFGIALAGTFFVAFNSVSQAGWSVVVRRVFEASMGFLPIGSLLLMIVFVGAALGWNHIYHWLHEGIMDPTSHHYDHIIAGKEPYLNIPFWLGRAVVFLGVYILFARLFRKYSLQEDAGERTYTDSRSYRRSLTPYAGFLVFFGFTSMAFSWDWIMSIDTHWFSTLFGWYLFSGYWLTGMVMVMMITLWLKSQGYLKVLNESHIQDIGKWVFAVSILWTYLFFSQYMLYWYSNIPEEVAYFLPRVQDYAWPFWGMIIINFIVPTLFLMSKETKRNTKLLMIIGFIVMIGHWVDTYLLIVPGAMQDTGSFGFIEVGMFMGYLGLYLFVTFRQMAKAPLVPQAAPLLDESKHHHIN